MIFNQPTEYRADSGGRETPDLAQSARMMIDCKDRADDQITGVLEDWSLYEYRPGVAVIWARMASENIDRGFEGRPVRTSYVIKIEDGHAVTMNSVYKLIYMGEE